MPTEHTLIQILRQPDPAHAPERARKLGHLGFMQWPGGLAGDTAYETIRLSRGWRGCRN